MNDTFAKEFLSKVNEQFFTGHAGEHAYRPALKDFFAAVSGLTVVNDPKRSEHGAPDFVFLKGKNVVIAYAEAKDITVPLDETAKSEQLERYYGYANLILTNCLEFRFFRNGQPYGSPIRIAEIKAGKVTPIEANFSPLEDTLRDFLEQAREPITSGVVLSKVMAGKARRIRDNITSFLKTGSEQKNESLLSVFSVIKKMLLADLDHEKFADMYAQTLVYGLFVARLYDAPDHVFTRQSARDLVPVSNPFLRQFFDHIAGASFDFRLGFIVNELCEEFTHADVRAIVHSYFRTDEDTSRDPIIHFYEDFLKEYNPKERLSMGVFYTPLPVVDFIVRSVDEILRKDFGLQGLADSSKVEITRQVQGKKVKQMVHKVQVLDPATGTGTFLNETILFIKKTFAGQEGRWPSYVRQDLLPRLHGFELMMAPYTIAHLKLSSTLKETGAEIGEDRIGVYLTNSLDRAEATQPDLFSFGLAQAITRESREAAEVKNELPIMVVIGNPPYSGESMNPGYTDNDVYKFEPGTNVKLQERNSKWINDDYVKFIRLAESMVEKNGAGVVGMITAHGYLDNPTFRGMRYHLMQTFDDLYVFDLHGNANRKETTPSGEVDKNIFDIKQGVAILLAVKKAGKGKKLAGVFRSDLQGTREEKFSFLHGNSLETVQWKQVETVAPNYEFVARNAETSRSYLEGFSVKDLFELSSVGIVTSRDDFVIGENKAVLEKRMNDFLASETTQEALSKFDLHETLQWKPAEALHHQFDSSNLLPISYRPFDDRFVYYHNAFIERTREGVMKYLRGGDNIALVCLRQVKAGETYQHVFVTNKMVESTLVSNKTSEIDYVFPLYRLSSIDGQYYVGDAATIPAARVPNIDLTTAREIAKSIGAVYYPVAEYATQGKDLRLTPEDIFNYIYAILYSPSYREKYKDFLKSNFPRVPYTKNEGRFFALAELGSELRKLHLLEHPALANPITTYSEPGTDEVEKVEYRDGNVYINQAQFFGGVPEAAWNFYIGGYQPAQKWLKDRKSRKLLSDDIGHYQKMIVALVETEKLMGKIDTLARF
jgi:predicted helicase